LRLSSGADLTARRMAADEATVRLATSPRTRGWIDHAYVRWQFHAITTLASRTAVYELTVPWGDPLDSGLGPVLLSALESRDFAQLTPGVTLTVSGASGFSLGIQAP
jgi:hypothetical protein